jgi:hypothetical protein
VFAARGAGEALFRAGTLIAAAFLLFSASALVAFMLAQTQARMLRFALALQARARAGAPLAPLVAAHLLDLLAFVPLALGALFFHVEFFGDQKLAFELLCLVWACELWALVSCRTLGSLRFLPRAFGLVGTAFHWYFLNYPFGYHRLALAAAAALLAAAAFHAWAAYELPALQAGAVSRTQPRHPAVARLLNADAAAART